MTKKGLFCAIWLAGALHGQTIINGDRRILGRWDASAATSTVPFTTGALAGLPAQCGTGELYFATDAAAGLNLYACGPANVWTTIGGVATGTAGGDLSGSYPNPTVAAINGTATPANNAADQVLATTAPRAGAWIPIANCPDGMLQYSTVSHTFHCGSPAYPAAGIANSTGSGWGASYTLDTDAALGANSDARIASQKAIKGYVDGGLGGKQATISGAPASWPAVFAPSPHRSAHATGGGDALTPADIGAEPADTNLVKRDGAGNVAIGSTVLCASIGTNAGTSYTVAATNNGCILRFTAAADVTLTIPSGLPAGFSILIVQRGAGSVVTTAGAGVTIRQRQSLTRTAGPYAIATLACDAQDDCILSGDLQ